MSELCKRQRNAEENDQPGQFRIEDVWQTALPAFTDRNLVDSVLKQFQNESGYIQILPHNMISLTKNGMKSCAKLNGASSS